MSTTPYKATLHVNIRKKSYASNNRETVILQDISFTANEHEMLAITGPSGCGKTTLLNLVSGLDTDYSGHIDLPPTPQGALPLAFVFQEPRLLPWRTIKQNIDLVLPAGTDSTELFKQMNIEDTLDRYPAEISLGMARRAALVRAFSVGAPLLVMDEPFTSLDERMASHLRSLLLSQLDVSPKTLLFVTHNIREALFLGTRLLVLSASPARLLGDIDLPGKPGRPVDEIENLRADVLARFPDVLV